MTLMSSPQIDQTTLSEQDNVAAVGHGKAINLRLDVDCLLRISLQPRDVDLDIEVTNAGLMSENRPSDIDVRTHFETIASSGMTSKCLAVMMSRLPVVVTKTLPRGAASSIVVTS